MKPSDGILHDVDGNDLIQKSLSCGATIGYGEGAEFFLDDLALWSRALSATEVYDIALTTTTAGFGTALRSHYKFESLISNVASDSSGGGNANAATVSSDGIFELAPSGTELFGAISIQKLSGGQSGGQLSGGVLTETGKRRQYPIGARGMAPSFKG